MLTMIISLFAFWIEEARGYELVYARLVMILGGMMVPIDIFPEWLERIARLIPFQYIVYTPASFAVDRAPKPLGVLLFEQWTWIFISFIIASVIFQMGVRKLNVNGG